MINFLLYTGISISTFHCVVHILAHGVLDGVLVVRLPAGECL